MSTSTIPQIPKIDIEHGGTNATTAAAARTNLDVYSKSETDSAISQSTAVESINPYSGVRVYKSGNVAEISFEGFSAQQAYSANEVLFTLPEACRPRYSISFLDTLNSGKRIAVDSAGDVYVTSALSSGNLLRGCVAYIC